MTSLVRANIFQRKTRAAITMLAVAVEVAAVIVLVGLTTGTIDEVATRIENVGADLMLQPPGASVFLGLSSTTMPEAAVGKMEAVEGVESTAPVLVWSTKEVGGAPVNIFGIEPESFSSVGGQLEMLEGRHLRGGNEMVVDRRLAAAHDLEVDQELVLLNEQWRIVGVSRAGIGARIYMPIETLQELTGLRDRVHLLFVKAVAPAEVGRLAERIESTFPGYQTQVMEQYSEVLTEGFVGLNDFMTAISGIAVVLSFLVILLAMYTSIIERTREIGILKALGASKTFIMRTIMSESLLLCGLGVIAGFGLTVLARELLLGLYPTLTVEITLDWLIYAALLGLLGGLLGSLYPAMRAAKQDAIRALRYE